MALPCHHRKSPYSGVVRRSILLLFPLILLLSLTWGRSPVPSSRDNRLAFVPEEVPPPRSLSKYLGPFRLEGAWHVLSANDEVYGYSALVKQPGGGFLAFNDAGGVLRFNPPDSAGRAPAKGRVGFRKITRDKVSQDVESVVRGPDGTYWVGMEGTNQIVRLNARLAETGRVAPPLMFGWGLNSGPEAFARLSDGRFVTIREVTRSTFDARLHEAVLFDGDPIEHPQGHGFLFDGPDNFSTVDMTVLPDGRALVLMRRFLWPVPMRFAGRIVIVDTRKIRPGAVLRSIPLASLASVLRVDNFEAISAVPQPDGRIAVWIMSDDNNMRIAQRTLLWKLTVDPAELPWP